MQQVIGEAKHFIEIYDLNSLQSMWEELQVSEPPEYMDIPTLFQKIYLHACLHKRHAIAAWLQDTVYPALDPIAQIALRQVFSYGRFLLRA